MASRGFPVDTAKQKFFEEVFDKERDARILYFNKELRKGRTPAEIVGSNSSSKQYDVYKKKIERHNVAATIDEITKKIAETPRSEPPRQKHVPRPRPSVENHAELTEMRPPSNTSRSMLYNGISQDGCGRFAYLDRRKDRIPENKYEFPIVSSWEYGWGFSNVNKDDIKKPDHGRTRVIHDTFYNRNGVSITADKG